ncbi:MAG TPA: diguanylate cyclase [Terriglobales bacterium]|nr:diguanylate cyclase [Terriglobales bacterium]
MLDLGRRPEKVDTAKRRERAEKFLQKGKTSAALEEYLAILQEDPDNDAIRQTAAELYASSNCPKEAAALLGDLFQRQAEAKDSAKAIVTYKKLVRFGSPTCEQSFRYGQFIEASNKKEALEAFEAALTGYGALHNSKKSLAVLEHIIALDPSGQNYWRAAELASELGDNARASQFFLKVGALEAQSGGKSSPWYERAFHADPASTAAAVAYGQSLIFESRAAEALEVLKPLATGGATATPEVKDLYGHALWYTGQLVQAEPVLWELFEQNSARMTEMVELIAAFLEAKQDGEAVALARKLEQHQRRKGNRREFIGLMKDVVEKFRPSSSELLEYLVELFNAANREHDYCETLIKLFDLYYAAGNFYKAGDCLDRAAEVDAYEPGHQKRLEMLRGKIDEQRLNAIATRFSVVNKAKEIQQQPAKRDEPDEPSMLQDLMLQAEILVQYGMRSKALERLERIQQLFPHEEERNEELQRLYMNVGLVPHYPDAPAGKAKAAAAAAAPAAATLPPAKPAENVSRSAAPQASIFETSAAGPRDDSEVKNLARVTEITRSLYQQANVKSVLTVAVNEIGTQWNTVRAIAGLRAPGKPPTLVLEYVAPGVNASELPERVKLMSALHDASILRGPMVVADSKNAPEMAEIKDVVKTLGGGSFLALPLLDGQEHVGVLILQAEDASAWRSSDVLVLRSLSEQIVLALHNARLRRLVRNLSVTDEKSGLLKRSSYIDVLLSEVKRATQQNSPTCLMLMEFGRGSSMVREFGQPAVETMMRQVGQIISTHIRQADVGVLYDLTTIALILADTPEKGAMMALDKLRKLLDDIHLPGRDTLPPISAGIAELVVRPQFDPCDIVTEAINRVEAALEGARSNAEKKVCALACAFDVSAVA